MTAHPITGLGSDVIQHAMHQPITGLGSDAIPACYPVKTLLTKEPAKAQKDEGKGRDFSGSFA